MTPNNTKVAAIGVAACLALLAGCEKSAKTPSRSSTNDSQATPEEQAVELFKQRINENGRLAFKSWNGKLKGIDSDMVLAFFMNSKVILEDRGIGVDYYKGAYEIHPNDRIIIKLEKYPRDWPSMVLSADGEDLLLHREDGHTSWLPEDHPDVTDPSVDGFWPFRAKLENDTQ